MAFFVQHTTGIVCAPMTGERADTLRLPQMVADNTDAHATAFTHSVDHVSTGTGVSAADHAATVRSLAEPITRPEDLRRPGHVFPLCSRTGGVLVRAGHTEAAVDLLSMAGADEVGVISELVAEDGSMRHGDDLHAFAAAHELRGRIGSGIVASPAASSSRSRPRRCRPSSASSARWLTARCWRARCTWPW